MALVGSLRHEVWGRLWRGGVATQARSIQTYSSRFGDVDVPNESFTEYVVRKVRGHDPAKNMLVCGLSGKAMPFGEFAPRVEAAAARLATAPPRGAFGAGSKMLIHAPNCLEFPVAFHAALALGGVVSTSNPLYTARELAHQVADADVSHVVTTSMFEDVVREALARATVDAARVLRR